MVWGCFSRDGVGPLHRVEGIMDRFVFKDIVEKTMLPFAKRQMPREWIYQQDNDPKHTSNQGVVFEEKNSGYGVAISKPGSKSH